MKPATKGQPTIYQIKSDLFMELWPKNNYLNDMAISSANQRVPHCAYFGGCRQNLKLFYPTRVYFNEHNGLIKMSVSGGRHKALWLMAQGVEYIPLDIMTGDVAALMAGVISVAKDIWLEVEIDKICDDTSTWQLMNKT